MLAVSAWVEQPATITSPGSSVGPFPHILQTAVFSWHCSPPPLYPQRTPLSNSDAETSESERGLEAGPSWTQLCLVLGDLAKTAVSRWSSSSFLPVVERWQHVSLSETLGVWPRGPQTYRARRSLQVFLCTYSS